MLPAINQVMKKHIWILVHLLAWIPFILLATNFWLGNLSVNPIQDMTHITGEAAIRLLVISLACTPLNILFGWRWVLPLRKPLGLYAFMYACLHFLVFVGLDFGFDWGLIWLEIVEKQYAIVGFLALLILLPLALTSNRWSMRLLKKNWKRLHQLVYLAGILAVLHFLWARKLALDPEALIYGGILAILLSLRLPPIRKTIINYRQQRKRLTEAAPQSQ